MGEHGPGRPLPNAPGPAASFCTGRALAGITSVVEFVPKRYHITDTGGGYEHPVTNGMRTPPRRAEVAAKMARQGRLGEYIYIYTHTHTHHYCNVSTHGDLERAGPWSLRESKTMTATG